MAGCALFSQRPGHSLFIFEFEDTHYEIAGFFNEDGESANFLILRDNETILFRAMDYNQTGVIDRVLSGPVSLEEANRIYMAGMEIAKEMNQFKEIERNRLFETVTDDYTLIVESIRSEGNQFQNRLLIYDHQWTLLGIYWDTNSDGAIDRTDRGELDPELVEELYSLALQRAADENRLKSDRDGRLIITLSEDAPSGQILSSARR